MTPQISTSNSGTKVRGNYRFKWAKRTAKNPRISAKCGDRRAVSRFGYRKASLREFEITRLFVKGAKGWGTRLTRPGPSIPVLFSTSIFFDGTEL
jgi:hypothetical protein